MPCMDPIMPQLLLMPPAATAGVVQRFADLNFQEGGKNNVPGGETHGHSQVRASRTGPVL